MKKGFVIPAGIVGLIFIVLLVLGAKGFFEEDVPAIFQELKNDICIPVENKWNFCFVNQSGIVIDGEFDKLNINLEAGNQKILCSVGSGIFKFKTVCKDEFGYLYERPNFNLQIIIAGTQVRSISKYEISSIFFKIARNPEIAAKHLWKDAQSGLILRGIIYLAEHPELFNQTQ